MPEPPDVGFIDHWILENPWPGALALFVVAIVIGWTALVQGRLKRLPAALALTAASTAMVVAGLLIDTSGERSEAVTRQFVEAVVGRDSNAAIALLAGDATFAFDSPRNPGHDMTYIKQQLRRVLEQFTISGNTITRLDGYAVSSTQGEAHLACITDAGYGPTLSKWVVQVRPNARGEWEITRLTCVEVNNRPASGYR
jgi:hypothetical protein